MEVMDGCVCNWIDRSMDVWVGKQISKNQNIMHLKKK